jgi:ClpP class serine protease
MLATFGGDAHAAYKIGRALQNKYNAGSIISNHEPLFDVFVPTYCKSAGTILVLGADRILMSAEAELGPIDVQLRKQDEVGEVTS